MVEPSISEREAAEHLTEAGLDVKPQTMRLWRFRGRGPAYLKPCGKVRYRRSDLDAFIEKSRVDPSEKRRR
jgi:hypothetical protein